MPYIMKNIIRVPCSCCGSVDFPKPFRTKRGKKNGSRSRKCIMCLREQRRESYYRTKQKNPKAYRNILNNSMAWAKRNREHVFEYQKRWEKVNAERIRKRKRAYYLKNKATILARNLAWKRGRKKDIHAPSEHVWRQMNRIIGVINKRKWAYSKA